MGKIKEAILEVQENIAETLFNKGLTQDELEILMNDEEFLEYLYPQIDLILKDEISVIYLCNFIWSILTVDII